VAQHLLLVVVVQVRLRLRMAPLRRLRQQLVGDSGYACLLQRLLLMVQMLLLLLLLQQLLVVVVVYDTTLLLCMLRLRAAAVVSAVLLLRLLRPLHLVVVLVQGVLLLMQHVRLHGRHCEARRSGRRVLLLLRVRWDGAPQARGCAACCWHQRIRRHDSVPVRAAAGARSRRQAWGKTALRVSHAHDAMPARGETACSTPMAVLQTPMPHPPAWV
jgi:hypothetical protein